MYKLVDIVSFVILFVKKSETFVKKSETSVPSDLASGEDAVIFLLILCEFHFVLPIHSHRFKAKSPRLHR